MDHRRGKDPTPQGRTPDVVRHSTQTPPTDEESQKFANSIPGPDVRKDGTYFLGYKRERTDGDSPADEG